MPTSGPIIIIHRANKIKENGSTLDEESQLKTRIRDKSRTTRSCAWSGACNLLKMGERQKWPEDRFIRGEEKSLLLVSFDLERRGPRYNRRERRWAWGEATCLCVRFLSEISLWLVRGSIRRGKTSFFFQSVVSPAFCTMHHHSNFSAWVTMISAWEKKKRNERKKKRRETIARKEEEEETFLERVVGFSAHARS